MTGKKLIFVLTLGGFFLTANLLAQVPYQNGEQLSFNKGWLFVKGEQSGAEQAAFDDSGWRALDLPHDWAIEGPFDVKYNARAGGLPFHGTGWYRKHFTVPAEQQGKRVKLVFDGAMSLANVWVNGTLVAERPYGYTTFFMDITDVVKAGEENVVAVRLTPEDMSSRWYPGAGLYRNTWIEYNEQVHFSHWATFVSTPEVREKSAQVKIVTSVENHKSVEVSMVLSQKILDPSGKEAARGERSIMLAPGEQKDVIQLFDVEDIIRWDVDAPNLYKLKTLISAGEKTLDAYETPFGIRSIEFSATEGFKLNGRYMKLNGVCMHHDLGPLGGAVNSRAVERQMEIMKSMGVNAIRTSHNPPSPELLEACDRLGLMVQDEAFDCWQIPKVSNGYNKYFDDWYEDDLRSMIRRDRNHPSVIMWSIGNEIIEQHDKDKGWIWAKLLSEICHDEDRSRPTTAGFNSYPGSVLNKLAENIDVVGLNYFPYHYEELMEQHPEMIVYGSETSSCVSSRGVYHLPIEPYKTHESKQVSSYDLIGPPWAYPPDVEFLYQDRFPQLLGEFIWTGFDYLGEPTPYGGRDNSTNGYWNDDWPTRSSFFGAVDLCGFPKDRYYMYQSQWTEEAMVHLLPHWNWKGMEGQEIPVYAYTNCEEAELFLNGKSLGKKVKGVDMPDQYVDYHGVKAQMWPTPYRLRWDVPYSAGELKVVAYKDGRALAEEVINTAGKPYRVELIPDRKTIYADGLDLSFITVRVLDKKGNLCPEATNLVYFHVSGTGSLRAVGNGNPSTDASFQVAYRKAFSGKCLVIVEAGEEAGEITVKATSKGLSSASTKIAVQ